MSTANTNPSNFANRSTEEVKAIASMGGKASHGGHGGDESEDHVGHLDDFPSARTPQTLQADPDGTFVQGSEAAKAAGQKGGLHSHDNDETSKQENVSELEAPAEAAGRNSDGTFTKGSEAAKEAGHKGGLAVAGN